MVVDIKDEALLYPLVLPQIEDIISSSCANATVTCLAAWRATDKPTSTISVAMGCKEGSIYFFHPESSATVNTDVATQETHLSSPTQKSKPAAFTNLSKLYRAPSPTPSTTSSYSKSASAVKQPSFQPSKSRVQAEISKEQVEAPKNYVDYDEEPAKLKHMLKTRETKDRGFLDSLMPSLSSHSHRPRSADGSTQKVQKEPSFSQPSVTNTSSTSTSPPASPIGSNFTRQIPGSAGHSQSDSLSLVAHTLSPRLGEGRAVRALQPLERGNYMASLQECGTLALYSSSDGRCISSIQVGASSNLKPPESVPHLESALKGVWKWRRMWLGEYGETTFLLLAASDRSTSWNTSNPKTRVAMVRVQNTDQRKLASPEDHLCKIGEWAIEAPLASVGLCIADKGEPIFYYVCPSSKLRFSKIRILERIKVAPAVVPEEDKSALNLAITNIPIPIPNPFKSKKPRISKPLSYDVRKDGLVELESYSEHSDLGFPERVYLKVFCSRLQDGEEIVVSDNKMTKVYLLEGKELKPLETLELLDVNSVELTTNMISLQTETEYCLYQLRREGSVRLEQIATKPIPQDSVTALLGSSLIFTPSTSHEVRKLKCTDIGSSISLKPKRLWKSSKPVKAIANITSLLSTESGGIIAGYDDGILRRTTFGELFQQTGPPLGECSDQKIDGSITYLTVVRNERTGEYYIIGGTDGGMVAIWNLQSLRLLARWVVFATPLVYVIRLLDDAVGRLRGHIMCAAEGGTLAIIGVDELEIAAVIPGGPSRLEKICLGEDNLMLIYENNLARLWDVKTQEFWRSMTKDIAEQLLEQGGWFEALTEPEGPIFSSNWIGSIAPSFASLDTAYTLVFNIRRLSLASANTTTNTPSPAKEMEKQKIISSIQRDLMKPVVACCLTFGLDESIDSTINEAFEVLASPGCGGVVGYGNSLALINRLAPNSVWTISREYTAWRLLTISSVLRMCLAIDGLNGDMNTVLLYYIASLPDAIGKQYCPPSLEVLARFWFDSNTEIRTSTRALFDAAVGQMTDEEVVAIAADLQHRLPCLQPDIHKEAPWSVLALLVLGNLAIARHATLSPVTITDIATSIALYLHDESSAHRVLGIDLSSRGLQIWEGYTDTMEILRSLFELATSPRKETDLPIIRNPGSQARSAILHIATTNTHLFLTKLLLDILQPKTPDHGKSIMQILSFLIRKKPLILYPNLSRLMEAVVKSMDPNSSFREMILEAATDILGQMVKTYPTVDFHTASQKLVVGTHEGAAVLYDLKTATRLYVLEGHKKRLAACSFSPDGRRLVTLSLEESVVMVWKVGSSFTSFFYPGAPPRQGHSGSEPFKTLSFNVGSEAHMTTAATLEWVSFDWPNDRTARLRIRDSVLTFNT
ncbi:hypothetical protein CPB86DRAFT_783642 [Serendipita vermifera]|nr:hypothetical protein CPB86DRAFT_783642 [Serendipita vermifera]